MNKFLAATLVVCLLSILYVFQQAKLLEYSYAINSNQKYVSLLVDQNKQLRYNVKKLETPTRLEGIMLAEKGLDVYTPNKLCRIQVSDKGPLLYNSLTGTASPLIKTGKALLEMFSAGNEAVADEQGKS